MRFLLTTATIGALTLAGSTVVAPSPAAAKTCKEPLTVTSRSTIKTSEEARTKRATNNAEAKWSKDARTKYGIAYYFWARSADQKVECRQTPKSTICTATATPCSLL